MTDPATVKKSEGGVTIPFFSENSFWNTAIPESACEDARSEEWINLLDTAQEGRGLHINLKEWTIPVFEADAGTSVVKLHPKLPRCPLSQGHMMASEPKLGPSHPCGLHASVQDGVPIPPEAVPDPCHDAHMVVVDPSSNRAFDFWQCRQEVDGSWHSNSAISYELDGPGIFEPSDLDGIENDESVHLYGPCRASGVPALAGLIMEDEIRGGRIAHRLAFACPVPALQERVFPPAAWTDGWLPGGVPEGCILQLDPALDLESLSLSPAAKIVARALQEFGAVLVDYAGSVTLSGELLTPHPGRSWDGLLGEWDLGELPLSHFRILDTGPMEHTGSHPVYHQGMSALFYGYLEKHGESVIPKRSYNEHAVQTSGASA
ncbi:hypothetical protein P3T73_03760 [Kiritimatiellota bacterium B12222]|nr:hypothetical protein P3T73_03760 [Kiritimatiellota bacterium B12222]